MPGYTKSKGKLTATQNNLPHYLNNTIMKYKTKKKKKWLNLVQKVRLLQNVSAKYNP